MRYISFSWDDGFRRSTLHTAEIFEKFGLRAEFNIITDWTDNATRNPTDTPFADWGVWAEMKQRGHIVHPHGTNHTNKAEVPLAEAQKLVLHCLDTFDKKLTGFDPRQAIFALPYLATTPELDAWFPTVVRAFRPAGPPINPLPGPGTVRINTGGAEDCEPWLSEKIEQLLAMDEGWLVLCVHALDGEGWGPVRSSFLEELLGRLTTLPNLQVIPAIEVLNLHSK